MGEKSNGGIEMAGNFNLNDYVQVNERIEAFYKKYPSGSIQTEILSNENGQVIFKAYIYRDKEDNKPCVGHAMEKEGSSFINKTSHIENCETSAVGRALAMMGFEIKKSIASKEEVENAKLNQSDDNKLNEKQVGRLFAIAKSAGYTTVKVKAALLSKYNITDAANLTKEQYDHVCQGYQKLSGGQSNG
jgi:hypothetical protein